MGRMLIKLENIERQSTFDFVHRSFSLWFRRISSLMNSFLLVVPIEMAGTDTYRLVRVLRKQKPQLSEGGGFVFGGIIFSARQLW